MKFARMGGRSEVSALLMMFVYGTLKRGESNHCWLSNPDNGISRFLGAGKTAVKYPLVIPSKYNIPFLLDVPGTGNHIEGEVFEIDDRMLLNLDYLEGYPITFKRKMEKIMMANNREEMCWTYFLNGHKPSLLELPWLMSYSTSEGHGLVNIERYLRNPLCDYRVEVILNFTKNKSVYNKTSSW